MFGPKSGPPPPVPPKRRGAPPRGRRKPNANEVERARRQRELDELAKEADRNTEYLERLGRAPLSSASPHHHVVLDHSDVPGLAGARSPSARDDRRAYPSWDEHGDTLGGAPNAVDDEIDAAYVAALPTASPGARAAAARAAAPYGVGAFPGHLEPAPTPSSATRPPPPGSRRGRRSSFAVRGEDPLEFDLDPRAVAEAEAAEAKRVELRRQLDEQVAQKQKQKRAAIRGRGGDGYSDDGPPEYSATVSPGIGSPGRQYAGPAHGFVPQRDVIPGVPRRGVNPGNGEYSSPTRRAGGGPSAWYEGAIVGGGAVSDAAAAPLSMGGDGVAPGRLPLGAPGMFPARAPSGPSQAELARLQLVADLDEQVRAKREERRLRELREALEEAKLERRVAEVVEQERREREMKERLLDFQNGGRGDGGGQNVGNSPRLGNSPPGSVPGAADDERSAAAAAAAAAAPAAPASPASPEPGVAREALPASPAPVASPEEDALTPHPKLPRSPDITLAKRSPPFGGFDGEGESPGGVGGEGGAEVLRVGVDAPGASAPATPTRRSSSPVELAGHRGHRGGHLGGTPLDRRIARLEAKLAARDEALERERADRERVERERDLAERERDLEQQLHKIRSELAGVARGDQNRAAAIGRAVAGYRDDVAALRDSRDSRDAAPADASGDALALARRGFVGTDIDSFVVDSGFVRVDAPVGHREAAIEGGDDGEGVELVPKGYTVRPDELMRRRREAADAGAGAGAGAPRVAGLSRRAARAAQAEREETLERAERERRRRISNQRIDAARMKENREALAARPAWGAPRRAGGEKRGNRWM